MIEVRSFRRVFDLERRIYSIDRFRLNPAGVPVRGIVYAVALVVTALALSDVPVIGAVLAMIPWYLRDLIAPAAMAGAMSIIRVDGRTFHLAAGGMIGLVTGPRRITRLTASSAVGTRWPIPELCCLPDGSDPVLRRFRYKGPGAVLIQVEHTRSGVREDRRAGLARTARTLRITGPSRGRRLPRGQVIALESAGRMSVEPG